MHFNICTHQQVSWYSMRSLPRIGALCEQHQLWSIYYIYLAHNKSMSATCMSSRRNLQNAWVGHMSDRRKEYLHHSQRNILSVWYSSVSVPGMFQYLRTCNHYYYVFLSLHARWPRLLGMLNQRVDISFLKIFCLIFRFKWLKLLAMCCTRVARVAFKLSTATRL